MQNANTWRSQLLAAFVPARHFALVILYQPSDGPMYDWAIDPSDDTKPFVTEKGLYALVGVRGDRSSSWNFNKRLFTFTVQPGSEGQILDWMFDNRDTGTGLSTRILDHLNRSVDITDNWVQVRGGGPTATTTTVVGSPNPSVIGQEVTFTAAVTPTLDGGTVQFRENGVDFGGPVSVWGGQAHTSRIFYTGGPRHSEAVYSGTAGYIGSTGQTTIYVFAFDSWITHPDTGAQYIVPSTWGTWPELQRIATLLGCDLVTINDASEAAFLNSLFPPIYDMFIGFRDVKSPERKWRWESGETHGYVNWGAGHPATGEVAVIAAGKAGAWETRSLSHMAYGIFERKALDVQQLEVPADGTPVMTTPLEAGKRYVIEASGEWIGNNHAWRADAEFFLDASGSWRQTGAGDPFDLLIEGRKVDWLGSSDGVHFRTFTYSPSHVYRYEVVGEGTPLALSVDPGGAFVTFGSLHVRVYSPVPGVGYQADSPWPTLHADNASTHNSPWALLPQSSYDWWWLSQVGEPLAINALGDIYCGWGNQLQRISRHGSRLGTATLPGNYITATAIGVDGTIYALTDTATVALTETLHPLWSEPRGGSGNLVLDPAGNLYHTGPVGNTRVFAAWPSGALRWTTDLGMAVNGAGLSIGPDEKLYVTADTGTGQCRVYRLLLDGTIEGFVTVPGYYASAPVLSPEGRMYVTTSQGLHCFDKLGNLLWSYPIPSWANGKPTILANGRIGVVGGWSPGVRVSMYQFDPDGTLLWRLPQTIQYVWAAGSDALGGMWNVSWNQDLWTGTFLGAKQWSRSFGPVYSMGGPIMGADGTLYQHVNDVLYAIGSSKKARQDTFLSLDNLYSAQGGSVTLRARLVLARNGGGVSGRTVSFYVGGHWVGNDTTDRFGFATVSYPVSHGMSVGRHPIVATWSGDDQYWASEAEAALWVGVPVSVIQGQVFLELWNRPSEGVPFTYQVLNALGQPVSMGWAVLGPSGSYRVEVQHSGPAALRVKCSHWLSSLRSGLYLAAGSPQTANFLLKNGDADGDNRVSIEDIVSILVAFGTAHADADLNGSGTVGVDDLSIALLNFGLEGS